LAAQAEAAVARVKDTELRKVAYDRILASLLAEDEAPRGRSNAPVKRPDQPPKASSVKPRKRVGPKGHVQQLVAEGFFKKQKNIADVKAELARRGHHIPLTSLSGPLQALTQARQLRRERTSKGAAGKNGWAYSEW